MKISNRMVWFRSIIFIIFIIGSLYLTQMILFTNDVAWARKQFYSQLDEAYDVVYMGNSHCFTSFSPKIIDAITGIDSYSLGIDSQLIDQTYYELSQLIKYQSPKIIILEANAFIPEIRLPQNSSNRIFSNEIQEFMSSYVDRKLEIVDNHTGWKLPDSLFKNMNEFIHFVTAGKATGEDDSGFHPLVNISVDGYLFSGIEKSPQDVEDLSNLNEEYLNAFRNLCKENGIQLIVMKSPLLLTSEYSLSFNQKSEDPFNYYDLNPLAFGFNRLHFQDEGHLSTFGSLINSIATAKILANEMDLEVDEYQKEYFESYIFDHVQVEASAGITKFTLMPLNIEKSSNLKYRWEITKKEEFILNTDYQENNFIEFQTVNIGDDYKIHVWINNPDGDYVLEGIFDYMVGEEISEK